jgi:hypothetical protein
LSCIKHLLTFPDTHPTKSQFKNKGKKKKTKMAQKEDDDNIRCEEGDSQSITSSILSDQTASEKTTSSDQTPSGDKVLSDQTDSGGEVTSQQVVQLESDSDEPSEVIDLIDSDSEMSDSNFSVIDLTLNETENEVVNFELIEEQEVGTGSEVEEVTDLERVTSDLEARTVVDVRDSAVEEGLGGEGRGNPVEEEIMENSAGREEEEHRYKQN